MEFKDYLGRIIRLTDERVRHIENDHPEMKAQFERIMETLSSPDCVIKSNTDSLVQMFYKLYKSTPVTQKHLCVLVKNLDNDNFVITSYFTDTVKKGQIVWEKQ